MVVVLQWTAALTIAPEVSIYLYLTFRPSLVIKWKVGKVEGLVLGTSKHRVEVLTIRDDVDRLEMTGSIEDLVVQRSYPQDLTGLPLIGRKNYYLLYR
jgi:hypothetical protein